ncbi:MAG: zinc ribbon domain-containing protein [Acidimicrobiales bacterium]
MTSPSYEQLLEVQALDLQLAQLRHRLTTDPTRAALAEAEAEEARVLTELERLDTERLVLERDRKRLDDEVEITAGKRSGLDAKLYDGSVTGTKELLALQDEIAGLDQRIRSLEDDELEIMEGQEALDTQRQGIEVELVAVRTASGTARSAADGVTGGIEDDMAEIGSQRDEVAAGVPAELMATYEALAPDFGGQPLAQVVDGRCSGCRIQLSAVARDQLHRSGYDGGVTCEECGRLLVG